MKATFLAGALALAGGLTSADTFPSGFVRDAIFTTAGSVIATLTDNTYVAFDGLVVTHHSDGGGLLGTLGTLTGTDFASFVRIDATETFAVVGESLNGGIYRVPLDGSGATLITTLLFNYDAVFADADTMYVSASHDVVFDNEIYRLTLSTGAFVQVAALAGFSGPVALRSNGDVYYGTAEFPVPMTGAQVLRLSAARVASGDVLTNADAILVGEGFEGASSFAYDPLTDELYLSASDFGSGDNFVYRVEGDAGASTRLVDGSSGEFISNLEFLPEIGAPIVFQAFQPEGGGHLRYSNYGGRYVVRAQRPQAFLTGPGLSGPGSFDVNIADGAPGGMAFTLYGPAALVPPTEFAIFLPNQGLNVFLGLDLGSFEADVAAFPLDGAGVGVKSYTNPGGLQGTLAIQALVLYAGGQIAGTSDVRLN